jgi:hypothetical protein
MSCTVEPGDQCGTCSDTPLGAEGSTCHSTADCALNLTCSATVCRASVDLGASCDIAHPCNFGLRCDSGTKKCVQTSGEGEACTSNLDCQLFASNGHILLCNFKSHQCAATTADAKEGETCGLNDDGTGSFCVPGMACELDDPSASNGKCVALRKPGETCSLDKAYFGSFPCEAGIDCIDGYCSIPSRSDCH